mmetsp:Transcript_28670/g.37578  ORF Transcript_28670/g.37578 Transcript_28670/m.37578 type:complete len:306 (+) Transcript_28670:87-1004(+)
MKLFQISTIISILFVSFPIFSYFKFGGFEREISRRLRLQKQKKPEQSFPKTAKVSINQQEQGHFIFVLGLEGTGHHMCAAIWNRCDRCANSGDVGQLIYKQTPKQASGIFAETNPTTFAQQNSQLVKKLAEKSKLEKGKLIILNTWKGSASGEVSYPNFLGPYRFTQHPHAIHMFEEAKKAGTKVKFLVLVRSAQQMIVSTTIHRHFEKRQREVKILENMCQELRYTLMEIGRENYGCIDYNNLDPLMLSQTGKTLGFNGDSFKDTILSIFHASSRSSGNEFSKEDLDFMRPLISCAENLRKLCL